MEGTDVEGFLLRLHRPLRTMALLTIGLAGLPAQDAEPTRQSKLDVALATLVKAADPSGDNKGILVALDNYLIVLGERPEATVLSSVAKQLRQAADGKSQLSRATITELFDVVASNRRRGQPERMLPALLLLQRVAPDDPRVLFGLGEAFGVASSVFDDRRADAAFARLASTLTPAADRPASIEERTTALQSFLPELGGHPDWTTWLRGQLLEFRESLAEHKPIRLWRRSDPRMGELREQLMFQCQRGDQQKVVALLRELCRWDPANPAYCYFLAEVHASLGPAFDPARAAQLLRQFLALTTDDGFAAEQGNTPAETRDQVLRQLNELELGHAEDGLAEKRQSAMAILEDLEPAGGKPVPCLLFPDKKQLETTIKNLEPGVKSDRAKLDKAAARIEVLERELQLAVADYEAFKRRPVPRVGIADPQPYLDAITSRKESISRHKKTRTDLEAKLDGPTGTATRLARMKERLSTYK